MQPINGMDTFILRNYNMHHPPTNAGVRTRMTSNGFPCDTRLFTASTARLPFPAIPTAGPYYSRVLTASVWSTRLSFASKMLNVTSFSAETGLTVFNFSAEMSAAERSSAGTGAVTCELMPSSKHHFTK